MAPSVQHAPMHACHRAGDEAHGGCKTTVSVHIKPGSQLTSPPLILKCGHEYVKTLEQSS